MTLKLEVGKRYRNRNGCVEKITSVDGEIGNETYGSDCRDYWPDGKFICNDHNEFDLIEEVIEPVKKPIKWAKEAHAWIDGIEVEGVSSKYQTWHLASQSFNPITHPHYEWRIAVPQWRKDLAEKIRAGGVLEVKYSGRWGESKLSVDQLLNPKIIMSSEKSFRIRPEPKPDVVEFYAKFPHEKLTLQGADFEWVSEDGKKCRQLKVIWDGETGNLKGAEVLK